MKGEGTSTPAVKFTIKNIVFLLWNHDLNIGAKIVSEMLDDSKPLSSFKEGFRNHISLLLLYATYECVVF